MMISPKKGDMSIRDRFLIVSGGIILFLYIITVFLLYNQGKSPFFVHGCVFSSLSLVLFYVLLIYRHTKQLVTPGFIFLCSYYVFQNGQFLLYSLSSDFDMFYLEKFSTHLVKGAVFSSISNAIAAYAYLVSILKANSKPYKISNIDKKYSPGSISTAAYNAFVATGVVAIPLVLYKFSYALIGGYYAVRSAESNIPAVVNFIEYMFPCFSVLCVIYCDLQRRRKIVILFFSLWLILTALCGDRTTGLAGILILLFLKFQMPAKKRGKSLSHNNIFIAFSAILLITLVSFIANFRKTGSISDFSSENNILISFVGELGFSVVPLLTIIDLCPGSMPFQYGLEYVQSFIGGCIPSFIDPTGTITYINSLSRNFETFQETYYGFDSFGIGWSLNAEAFHNFGWYGLIALFFINSLIFRFLSMANIRKVVRDFNLYSVCILLFMWITLPRRDSYYIWKALVYTIFFVQIYIKIMCQRKTDRIIIDK